VARAVFKKKLPKKYSTKQLLSQADFERIRPEVVQIIIYIPQLLMVILFWRKTIYTGLVLTVVCGWCMQTLQHYGPLWL
jgi:hypothetical protein